MRNTFSEQLYLCASRDESISVVVADISPAGSMVKFRTDYPGRFINVGVSEQLMIGIAAGLALSKKKPFVYTIATFALFRPYEMIRVDLCYQKLPVTIVGMGAGVIYSTLGSTHHAMEDIGMTCALPNMQVLSPCDPNEVKDCVNYAAEQEQGPVYLRLGKSGELDLTTNSVDKFEYGKLRMIQGGLKICFIGYGPILSMAFEVSKILQKKIYIKPTIYSCHTLKPLDVEGILHAVSIHDVVIVLEEHVYHGGLGMMIEAIAQKYKITKEIMLFNLRDEFIHCYGEHKDILQAHGLSVENLAQKILLNYGS